MEAEGYDIGPDVELRGMHFHHASPEDNANSTAENIRRRFPEGNVIGLQGVHAVPYVELLDESPGPYLAGLHRGTPSSFYRNGAHSSDTEMDKLVWDPSEYASEAKRLRSFRGWPYSSTPKSVRPEGLAKDGFWYQGPKDRVQCVFCGKTVSTWEDGDDIHEEHKRLKPDCPFICGKTDQDIPLTEVERSAIVEELMADKVRRDSQASDDDKNEMSTGSAQLLSKPKFPQYAEEASRLATYTTWPQHLHQKPEDLSKAGLFYMPKPESKDNVCCFFCGETIYDWERDDDPWEEHAAFSPDCQFIREQNGQDLNQKGARNKRRS